MYIDYENLLCDAQAITVDAVSENTIDLSAAKNIAQGKQLYVVVVVDTTFAGGTSLIIQVITDSVAALNDTPTVQAQTPSILQAALTAGRAPIVIPIASVLGTEERYLGLNFDQTGDFTGGAVTAFIAVDVPQD